MRIRIIGGGWYGCHIALHLIGLGHNVTVFEKGPELFGGASGANQSRLHLGFHYPRSALTRRASLEGYQEFIRIYPDLVTPVPCNLYCIANDSLIDFQSYLSCMEGPHYVINPDYYDLCEVEGAVQCPEMLIDQDKARLYFTKIVNDICTFNTTVEKDWGSDFEWTIDCTFGAFGSEHIDLYEPCIMHLYDGPDHMAITIMDGPFASIYPHYSGGISLTSVLHTPMVRTKTYEAAEVEISEMNEEMVQISRHIMEEAIKQFVPWFDEQWKWRSYVTSIRGVPASRADSRRCLVLQEGRLIYTQPGKIDAIFSAARRVEEIICST